MSRVGGEGHTHRGPGQPPELSVRALEPFACAHGMCEHPLSRESRAPPVLHDDRLRDAVPDHAQRRDQLLRPAARTAAYGQQLWT